MFSYIDELVYADAIYKTITWPSQYCTENKYKMHMNMSIFIVPLQLVSLSK